VDEYINCDPLGMSQEDPTIVVTPIRQDRFVGGAGIVAAHAAGLGARVRYFGVVGSDATAQFADERLGAYGVGSQLVVDGSRPTSLKQRFRAGGKTLLRVSHLRQHDVSQELADELFANVEATLDETDLLIFSDFNYGCLPQALVDRLLASAARRGVTMVADSQTSSQIGDVSRFKGMRLITPTEYEARLAVRDQTSGLVVLAEALRRQARADQLFITLGAEGLLIHARANGGEEYITDQLPALNSAPKDVSGAGDSLLTCASLALRAGADIWQSAYLGSVAAACQVSRVGNSPLTVEELVTELTI
jgi:rfaE bifunctional protein kinase chain/domain